MRFGDIAAFVLQHATFPPTSSLPKISPCSPGPGVGGWSLGYEERICWANLFAQLVSKIFNLCGHDPPTSQTDGQTDRQTTCDSKTAVCTVVHRAVIKLLLCKRVCLSGKVVVASRTLLCSSTPLFPTHLQTVDWIAEEATDIVHGLGFNWTQTLMIRCNEANIFWLGYCTDSAYSRKCQYDYTIQLQ